MVFDNVLLIIVGYLPSVSGVVSRDLGLVLDLSNRFREITMLQLLFFWIFLDCKPNILYRDSLLLTSSLSVANSPFCSEMLKEVNITISHLSFKENSPLAIGIKLGG